MDMTQKNILYNRIIFVLSLLGVAMAIYVLQSWLRKTSIVCLTNGCESVRKSSASYIMGIPVPAIGLVGYSVLAVCAFLRSASKNTRLLQIIVGVSTFGIAFVSWFTYTEIFVIRGICTWCAVSALNMWIIFLFAIKSSQPKINP